MFVMDLDGIDPELLDPGAVRHALIDVGGRGKGTAARALDGQILSDNKFRLCSPIDPLGVPLDELLHDDLLDLQRALWEHDPPLVETLMPLRPTLDEEDLELAAMEVVGDDELVAVAREGTARLWQQEIRVRLELWTATMSAFRLK